MASSGAIIPFVFGLPIEHVNDEVLTGIDRGAALGFGGTSCGLPVKLVFVQNRNKRREWLAILSTDLTVSADEVVRV
ncbi:hypothetical protein QFZ77_003217 [Paenibacillus sp. V4I3]|nr:hypothetical protein [Paenibacillus sp. V4I3]MDQ0889690.1 hypothetical protein [Paenibacillus sp. V4I9]